jgi:hypothetical protein
LRRKKKKKKKKRVKSGPGGKEAVITILTGEASLLELDWNWSRVKA